MAFRKIKGLWQLIPSNQITKSKFQTHWFKAKFKFGIWSLLSGV